MRIALLDEDRNRSNSIEEMIIHFQRGWSVKKYSTPFALVTGISDELKGDVDVMIVHIPPNNLEYIQMARDVQSYFGHIRIVFYSEINEMAEEIFMARPIFFMKLPFSDSRLQEAMDRMLLEEKLEMGQTLTIKSKGNIQKIPFKKITYIESVARKMRIYTTDGSFDVYMKMDELIELLPEHFRQCHRSYIVNVDKIIKLNMDGILLESEQFIPLSRTHYRVIRDLLT